MKKLVSMYQKYMFRPILYKSVTRVSVVAVLMLLWDRYVSDGTFTMWQAPALLLGVVLLAWAVGELPASGRCDHPSSGRRV